MRKIVTGWLLLGSALAAVKTGPDPGAPIPRFSLKDQDGRTQTLRTLAGPKGAMLVFYRSADW
jgi:hypothetical protein